MEQEVIFKNERAYIGNLTDYERILEIFDSRTTVRTVTKNRAFIDHHKTGLLDILLSNQSDKYILVVEDINSKILLNYRVVYFPVNSKFSFSLFGSARKSDSLFGEHLGLNSGSILLQNMMRDRMVFDNFVSIQLNYFLPFVRTMQTLERFKEEKSQYVFQLHSIVQPNQKEKSSIEKVLTSNNLIEYDKPMAIVNCSLKPEFRVLQYKDQFNLSENMLVKYFKDQ